MDLVDRLETTRFLGAEFLLWLWFAQDVTQGKFEVGEFGLLEVSLEAHLKLVDLLAPHETVTLSGKDPFGSPEAEQALKSGEMPSKAVLRVKHGDSEWLVTLGALSLAFSSVKLPGHDTGEEEQLFERMRLLEQLDDLVHALYRQFLSLRCSASYRKSLVPAVRQWVQGSLTLDERGWTRLLRKATLDNATPLRVPARRPSNATSRR